ncbi:MAG: hypothetical protein Q7S31_02780 [bacterium]|nr:hypothetical protein [bacterium]
MIAWLLIIFLLVSNLVNPLLVWAQPRSGPPAQTAPVAAVPDSCRKMGVNFATPYAVDDAFYEKAYTGFGMGWTLAIAFKNDPGSAVAGINSALSRGLKPVVRIGVGTADNGGFFNPQDYVDFLNGLAGQVGSSFYAVAGPNEPDSERWLDPLAGDGISGNEYSMGDQVRPDTSGIDRGGYLLAQYMNYLVAAKASRQLDSKVLLLSPTINLSSWSGEPLIEAMLRHGANFGGLDGFSGTSYSFGNLTANDIPYQVGKVTRLVPGISIVLNEFQDTSQNRALLKTNIGKIKSGEIPVMGALLFNAFNTNTGWSQFALTDTELADVLGAECVNLTALAKITRPTPRPTMRPCPTEDSPEFHPLRPYPGEPCDPLIPRSDPYANRADNASIPQPNQSWDTQLLKDYQMRNQVVFACGNSLTPTKYHPFDRGSPNIPAGCTRNGNQVECVLNENFDMTLDMTDSQVPILGNTQISGLTDAQKMTEYLSWFLNGTVQQAEQDAFPSIYRLVNFSGPLQKLLPFDFKNFARSELAKGNEGGTNVVGTNLPNGQYHNYIVGCQKDVNLDYIISIIEAWFDTFKAAFGLSWTLLNVGIDFPLNLYNFVKVLPEEAAKLSPILKTLELADLPQVLATLNTLGQTELAKDIGKIGEKGVEWIHKLGDLMDAINLDMAVSCKESNAYLRLKDYVVSNPATPYAKGVRLPPDPTDPKYTKFSDYWNDYVSWQGYVNIPIIGPVDTPFSKQNIWAQLFQNIPFSSLEDTTGEVVISVSDIEAHNQQDKDVIEAIGKPGGFKPKLYIKRNATDQP